MIRPPPRSTLFPYTTLFDLSQPTVSHHLKVLHEAGIVGSERKGLWPYYYVNPVARSEEHTSELPSRSDLACRLLLGKQTCPLQASALLHASDRSPSRTTPTQ